MKISTKLKGSAVLIIGMVVIFVGAVLYVSIKVRQAGERNQIAQKILETSVTGVALRVEYGLTSEERPKVQWYALQTTFNNTLDQAAPLFIEPANQTLFAAIRENQERKKVTFDAVVAAIEHNDTPELTARLNSQLAVIVQEGVSVAKRLAELSREEHSAFHQMLKSIIFVPGLFVILFALISYFVSRSISSSLLALQQEFIRIASLDFSPTTTTTTTTTTGSNDEIGQLARAFNTMVEKLKESYQSLERKIKERTVSLSEVAEAAEAVKAKDEAILSSIGDGVMACSKDGRIMLFNAVAETLTGFSVQEVISRHYSQVLKFVRESDEKPCDDFIAETIKTGQGTKMANHTLLITKDGRKIPVADSSAPIKNVQGEIIGCVLVFRDMAKEREIDRAKSEFVSLASHQLRTPLTGIEWTIELFSKKEKLTAEGKKYLRDIRFSASRLSALIKLLLSVSRIESGAVGVLPESLELVEFIKIYIRDCPIFYKKRNVSLIFIKHPEKLNTITDKNLFGFILQNLVSNAIEYSLPGGKVEIGLEEKKDTALLTVRDRGIGVPKKEQARIFEKFVRASNAITAKPDGTGLGLYIVRESVNLLGGKIWFESEEGKGSVFYVEIPLQSASKEGGKQLADGVVE